MCFQSKLNEPPDPGGRPDPAIEVKGIINESQTCYLNSSVQLLLACKSLMERVLSVDLSPGMGFFTELTKILRKYAHQTAPLNMESEKRRIVDLMRRRYHSQIAYDDQQDAHEVLLNMFRMIRDDFDLVNVGGSSSWSLLTWWRSVVI